MDKLISIEKFEKLQKRLAADRDPSMPTVIVPAGTCGQACGANELIRAAKRELLRRQLSDRVRLRVTGCHGFCQAEPSLLIQPHGTFYPSLTAESVPGIIGAVAEGRVVEDLLFRDPSTGERIEKQQDVPFFKSQVRRILSRSELIDPIRVYDYLENGGYTALVDVLRSSDPKKAIDEVKRSRLRGRGGAGFPTGMKWEFLANQRNGRGKYLVCNADEGDPGAYMDRSILEGNPHSVIEGMLIGGFATGADRGVIYVRDEYPLAIKHLRIALRQCSDLGLLGDDILGTGYSFEISLIRGAGAFVCGEETALIRSIEGKVGEPRQRPPFPIQKGINGKPTAINNVETWANIPVIFSEGGERFAEVGTERNTGTKIFSLVGKIRNTGLVEVPMGMSIEKIVKEIGGGPAGRGQIKAVQTGGPSGGCIPTGRFDLQVDYDTLSAAGSIMGSGGMIVMDESTCMVDLAKYFVNFLKDESCGKCFTCRKGTQRMHEILDDVSRGRARLEDLDLLEELALVIRDTTMCGLGQTAANPVLSTLRYFRDEYIEHIYDRKCRAFVCSELVGAPCASACPIDTEAWRYVAHIARGEYEEAYQVIREANPFPSVCARVCSHHCETVCRSGTVGKGPIAIRALKRFVTDRVDPSVYKPRRANVAGADPQKVAIVGSGPAGLSAAHCLSLAGYKATVFENDEKPGGMLVSGIPAYRLPRDTLQKEIDSLIDDNVTVRCCSALGRDFTIDSLFEDGFKAVFLAIGAHKSRSLNLEHEDVPGVYPAIEFLKAFNLRGEMLAKGRVGVIGGGDSAVDAAGVALRQPGVESVTIIYRRTRGEMPAQKKDVDSVLEEGVRLESMMAPVRILTDKERLAGVECIRNRLGEMDAAGRRRPVPIPGSEQVFMLDTLIVTIGDVPDIDFMSSMGIEVTDWGGLRINEHTLATSRPGVFAGGDVVTGPNTVVKAIAAGKRAATMIGRYLRGEELRRPGEPLLPKVYVEPVQLEEEELSDADRIDPPTAPAEERRRDFSEVEYSFSVEDATREARRCLRCDLDFTRPKEAEAAPAEAKGGAA